MAKKIETAIAESDSRLLTFQALADEKRLKVLELIRDGEKNGTYLRNELDIPQSSLSYHMKLLCDSGVVLARNQGKSTFYRINAEKSHNEADLLAQLLTEENGEAGAVDERQSFVFGMSRDIRTPLNAVVGYTAMAQKHIDNREKTMDCLKHIDIAGRQLMALTDEVLEMARLASGDLIIEEMPVDLRHTGSEIQEEIERMTAERGIEFSVRFNNLKNPKVYCDYIHINDVLQKLLDNAIRYTAEGGTVTLTVEQGNAHLEGYEAFDFIVQDNGIGMSEKFLPLAFDAFTREKNSLADLSEPGAGLGLTIAKKLAGLLGSRLELSSKKDVGTTAVLHTLLKLQPEEGAEELEEKQVTYLKGRRLLLVEDNEMNREVLKDMLLDEGIIVEEADDGDIALALVKKAAPDYYDGILMDIAMPRMDGLTATRLIRSLDDTVKANLPIIAVTANSFPRDREKALDAGMNELFPKPINRKGIRDTLKRYLQ